MERELRVGAGTQWSQGKARAAALSKEGNRDMREPGDRERARHLPAWGQRWLELDAPGSELHAGWWWVRNGLFEFEIMPEQLAVSHGQGPDCRKGGPREMRKREWAVE